MLLICLQDSPHYKTKCMLVPLRVTALESFSMLLYKVLVETLWFHRQTQSSHQWTQATCTFKIHQTRIRCNMQHWTLLSSPPSTTKEEMLSSVETLVALMLSPPRTNTSLTMLKTTIISSKLIVAWNTHGLKPNNLHLSIKKKVALTISIKLLTQPVIISMATSIISIRMLALDLRSSVISRTDPLDPTTTTSAALDKWSKKAKCKAEDNNQHSGIKICNSNSNRLNSRIRQGTIRALVVLQEEPPFSMKCKAPNLTKNDLLIRCL